MSEKLTIADVEMSEFGVVWIAGEAKIVGLVIPSDDGTGFQFRTEPEMSRQYESAADALSALLDRVNADA